MHNTLNDRSREINSKWLQEKIKVAVQETLDGLEENQLAEQATLEIDLFSRASATRARCREHASKDCTWTTCNSMGRFHWM